MFCDDWLAENSLPKAPLTAMQIVGPLQNLGAIAVVPTRDLRVDGNDWSLLVHSKRGKDPLVPLLPDVTRIFHEVPPG